MDKHISMDTARDILAEHYGSASPETEAVLMKIWDELDGAASDELSRRLEDLQRENAYLDQERAALWRWHDQREEKDRWRCQVGDTVYQTDGVRIYESTIRKIIYDTGHFAFDDDAIGRSVFLTREEAGEHQRRD